MTPQEIIDELNKIKPHTEGCSDIDRRDRAIEAAKKAVLRRTPTKILRSTANCCPICYEKLCPVDNYCPQCGQALDWRKGEANEIA